jgi:hypothetical protein
VFQKILELVCRRNLEKFGDAGKRNLRCCKQSIMGDCFGIAKD